jgi:hypothetical protein
MTDARTLHRQSMELADEATILRRTGDEVGARVLFHRAFELERSAAEFYAPKHDAEPTRSVLLRSAATLALDAGDASAAEKLIATALTGNPPEAIANELRDLLEMVYFQRHLDLRGIKLESDEFQFAIEGQGIGFGIAPTGLFIGRVRDVETLLYRTAERKLGRPFRERGKRKKALEEGLQLYVSTPRAASFAVTFRVGASPQIEFPETSLATTVVSEVLECLYLLNSGDTAALSARFDDEAYLRNFVGLAQSIAPDGVMVKSVGFTAVRANAERRVLFTRPRGAIAVPEKPKASKEAIPAWSDVQEVEVEIAGVLLEADGTNADVGHVQVRTEDGNTELVIVPRGLMRDIVRPLFDEEVRVVGTRTASGILFKSIRPDD